MILQEPYDKRRPVLFKEVKKGANDWVGAYARGGNVRKQSARSFYVAVDSLQVHHIFRIPCDHCHDAHHSAGGFMLRCVCSHIAVSTPMRLPSMGLNSVS